MNIDEMLEAVRGLPEGDYAECGVYKGASAARIAARMNPGSFLLLFDSFQGHAEPSEFDDASHHPKGRYSDTSLGELQALLPKAVIVDGFLSETLRSDRFQDTKFRFVHIDMDHYLPTKLACEFFKPRMVSGGVIRFDDYLVTECPGATKGIDEVFGRESILLGDARWVSQ
jgi:O-methyltransferase